MEKDLFRILQNIKTDINTMDLDYLQDKLISLNYDCMHEENNFEYYNKKFFLNNIKFLLIKIFTFGNCTQNQIYKYTCIRESLENNLAKIEERYNLLFTEFVVTEVLLEINTNKEVTLRNNYKQIDTFLEFIDKLEKEEKEKIFSYKMGVNNG